MSDPKHVEVSQFPSSSSTTNPVTQHLNVTLSVPQTIEIKMVDASALSDYEISFFITSLCFSALFGFVVPFVQSVTADPSRPDKALGRFSIFLLVLSLTFLFATLRKRRSLTQKSKSIPLKVSEAP